MFHVRNDQFYLNFHNWLNKYQECLDTWYTMGKNEMHLIVNGQ
jgi:hypothetical protein